MILLYRDEPHWRQMLEQEGVPFGIGWHGQTDAPAVILPSPPDRGDAASLRHFVECGGGLVAGVASAARVLPEIRVSRRPLHYIVPDASGLFSSVDIVHVGVPGWHISGANSGFTDRGEPALLAGHAGAGRFVVLPFEPADALTQCGTAQRRFWCGGPRFAVETVSRVARGEVRRLVANCLRSLLWQRGLSYVHLGCLPAHASSLFGFRLDTDDSASAAQRATVQLGDECGLKPTWFFNTGAKGFDIRVPQELAVAGQDVQLHCNRHRVFDDYERNAANLTMGTADLAAAGVRPVGFASPYGVWNSELDSALAAAGFEYSSEFGWGYDDLPGFPLVRGRRSSVLQIPVHPICYGNLRAARADTDDAKAYFKSVMLLQLARGEPCFLYDHPAADARHHGVMRAVVSAMARLFSRSTTLTDYAHWWRQRTKALGALRVHAEIVEVSEDHREVMVMAETSRTIASWPMARGTVELAALPTGPHRPPATRDLHTCGAGDRSLRLLAAGMARSARRRLQERGC